MKLTIRDPSFDTLRNEVHVTGRRVGNVFHWSEARWVTRRAMPVTRFDDVRDHHVDRSGGTYILNLPDREIVL
jgi:hypothetical protein